VAAVLAELAAFIATLLLKGRAGLLPALPVDAALSACAGGVATAAVTPVGLRVDARVVTDHLAVVQRATPVVGTLLDPREAAAARLGLAGHLGARATRALRNAAVVGTLPFIVWAAVLIVGAAFVLMDAAATTLLLPWAAAVVANADLAAALHILRTLALARDPVAGHDVRAFGDAPSATALGATLLSLFLLLFILVVLVLATASIWNQGRDQTAGEGKENAPPRASIRRRADHVIEVLAVHVGLLSAIGYRLSAIGCRFRRESGVRSWRSAVVDRLSATSHQPPAMSR
jgi:hypothetical protein